MYFIECTCNSTRTCTLSMCNTAQHIKLHTHILHPHPYTQYTQTSLHGETHQRMLITQPHYIHGYTSYMLHMYIHTLYIAACLHFLLCHIPFPPHVQYIHYTRNLTTHPPPSQLHVHITYHMHGAYSTLTCEDE